MQQQLQMQQLEAEIARLQVELRQVRQMIGSLIRTEQETWQMAYQQPPRQGGNQQMLPQQFISDEMRAAPQYQQMRDMGERLDTHLQDMSQYFQQDTTQYRGNMMNPSNNDPVQRQY